VGVSKERAAENRRAIVAAASRLFRERGVDGVGLTELMKEAGFTQGGFYNHFPSKDALVAEVVASAMIEGGEQFAKRQRLLRPAAVDALSHHIEFYLSSGHRDDIDGGCPVAGFAGDARRLRDDARSNYAAGVEAMIGMIEGLVTASGGDLRGERTLRERATRIYCEMAGALLLSRAVKDVAPALASELLETSRRGVSAVAPSARRRAAPRGRSPKSLRGR